MDDARDSSVAPRQWLPLVGLTLSAFVFNTSEFMPIGLLCDIAAEYGLTEAGAGAMISVYAWAVTLLSLPLMIAASRIELKRLLLGLLALFAAGQLLAAAAPAFAVLVAARVLTACAHAVFWSIAAVLATRLVDARHASLAVGMVATGTSIAMIMGLPLGRAIGLLLGWRLAFAAIGVAALAIAAYQGVVMPRVSAGEPFGVQGLPGLLRNRVLVGIYIVTLLFAMGYYTGYSYIEPFLMQVGGMADGQITALLGVFGLAGLAGSLALARLYDGRRAFFLVAACAGVGVPLLLMRAAAGSALLFGAVCAVWGFFGTAYNIAFQAEVIGACRRDESTVAMSLYSGIFNLGIGSGSALGGAVASKASIELVGYVGGASALVAAVVCLLAVVAPLGLAAPRGNRAETR